MGYPLFTDVSNYQASDTAYFVALKGKGVVGNVVKLTEGSENGSAYSNPKAAAQIRATMAAGLQLSCYHFFRGTSVWDSINEAKWFAKVAKSLGIGNGCLMVCDVEVKTAADMTSCVNAFYGELAREGYGNVDTYTGGYFLRGYFTSALITKRPWIAAYQTDRPGVDNAGAWQFADTFGGLSQDISYDFDGRYTKGAKGTTVKATPAPKVEKTAPKNKIDTTSSYTVKSNDTLSAIAAKYKTTVDNLTKLNGLANPDKIFVGQVLRVKGDSSDKKTVYTVQAQDTLSGIAAKFGTTVAKLQSTNGIKDPNVIYVGQTIRIDGQVALHPAATKSYKIKSGDTLSAIAAKNGTTWQALAQKNGIANANHIYAGQIIKL